MTERDWQQQHDYDYPDGLNLFPGSDLHKKLLSALNDRVRRGYATGQSMRDTARKLDHLQTAYVPADSDSILEMNRNPKSPVNVVIPISRANLDVITAYEAGVMFSNGAGMYQLDALGDREKMVKAAKMERLINTQAHWFQHKLSHFTTLRDANLYGLGIQAPIWTKHKRREAVIEEITEVLYELLKGEVDMKMGDLVRFLEERVYHEGCRIDNVDVYALIIDPYAKLNNYRQAEFIGYWRRTHDLDLLSREPDEEERLFNCKYVKEMVASRQSLSRTPWTEQTGRFETIDTNSASGVPGHPGNDTTREVDVAHLHWTLIPSDWGLSDSEHPETYAFAVAGDEVIIQCYSLDYDHGMLPMTMCGPQTCGYDLMPVSSLAATYGMHQFIDWKVRCHYWNASKVQNDMFVIDGSVVNADDFKTAGPGKLIRLLRPVFGTSTIDQFIKQLDVKDITNDYLTHVRGMMDLNNVVLGTQDIMMGDMSKMPDRPTQWGLQAAQQNAFSRLQKDCEYMTEQAWYTLIQQLCHNNIQFMEHEMVVSIIGSQYEKQLREELGISTEQHDMIVDPWDLDMTTFGIQPMARMAKDTDLQVMSQLMDRVLAIPELSMDIFGGIDVQRMFLAMVRKMGFPNVQEFRKEGGQLPNMQAQTMPDEQVMAQAEAGNLVPAGGMM